MLTEAEFAEQQIMLGRRVHYNEGVYWEEVRPWYCKPAFIYSAFEPGEARPAFGRRWLGFSHQVMSFAKGNRSVRLMVIDGERLKDFSMMALPSKKRNQVRRGLRDCEVELIQDLEPVLERIREINISQAVRQQEGRGAETPARRYLEEADEWRVQVRRDFSLPGREWWGAYIDGELAAYMRSYQVGDTRVIEQTKADSKCLKNYPMDALYFSVLSEAAADEYCCQIVNGRPMHASLNHYKEQFLFKNREYPYFSSHAWMVELGKRITMRRR